jgi:Bacterial dnaA protein helix-turn-helix
MDIESVIELVAKHYHLTFECIHKDGGRSRRHAYARHVAMWVSRYGLAPEPSLPEIARAFGVNDHSSVSFALDKITRVVAIETSLEAQGILDLRRRVAGQAAAATPIFQAKPTGSDAGFVRIPIRPDGRFGRPEAASGEARAREEKEAIDHDHYREGLYKILRGDPNPRAVAASYLGEDVHNLIGEKEE